MTRQLKQTLLLRTTILKTLSSEKEKQYCNLLHLWLRKRCTRDEFDLFVTKLLTETGIKLHTKFLNNLSRLSCRLTTLPLVNFSNNINCVKQLKNIDNIMLHKFIDKTLPCVAVCTARFYVIAWETGIVSVETQLGKLLKEAVIYFLKDLIFTLLSTKKSYKVKQNSFKYLVNNNNTSDNKGLMLPNSLIHKNKISVNDLLLTLQLQPAIVKMGSSKYIEQIINGPNVDNNVATLMPL